MGLAQKFVEYASNGPARSLDLLSLKIFCKQKILLNSTNFLKFFWLLPVPYATVDRWWLWPIWAWDLRRNILLLPHESSPQTASPVNIENMCSLRSPKSTPINKYELPFWPFSQEDITTLWGYLPTSRYYQGFIVFEDCSGVNIGVNFFIQRDSPDREASL